MGYKKIELQKPRKQKCNLCNMRESIQTKLDFFREGQLVGDLFLCEDCLELVEELLEQPTTVSEEWSFGQGGEG